MLSECPTLHMLCGKIASGKSTLAARFGAAPGTVLLAEDVWLKALFADELVSLSDYVRCSSKLRRVMGPHVTALLNARLSVVLDFAANTLEQRRWMRGILDNTNASHKLHLLTATDEACLARLRARNATGVHPLTVTETEFQDFSSYCLPPTPHEGFHVVVHDKAHDAVPEI